MKASSDKKQEQFNIANVKAVMNAGALRQMQENTGVKSRITMRVDSDVLELFRARAAMSGGNYQTLMNDALRQYALGLTLAEILDASVREAVGACLNNLPQKS